MSNFKNELIDLMKQCIVKITVIQENRVVSTGTGFFVAPHLIMTCAHVVKKAYDNDKLSISIHFNNETYNAEIERFIEDLDVCLLHTDILGDFCVHLDEVMNVGDDLYALGYPENYDDPLSVKYEGDAKYKDGQVLAKLTKGRIQPGFSGAPLLNFRTGGVCGIVKRTHDRNIDLGGRAIPIAEVFSLIDSLREKQGNFHKDNKKWKKLASKLRKENKQDSAMRTINQQKQKVTGGVQYNVGGNIINNDSSPEKSNKNLYLVIAGAVAVVLIIAIIAMVALKPTISNVTTGDGATGVVTTGDGNVTITSDKESE